MNTPVQRLSLPRDIPSPVEFELHLTLDSTGSPGRLAQLTADYLADSLALNGSPVRDSIMTITSELLDNAVKYSAHGDDPISLRVRSTRDAVEIETSNTADSSRAGTLRYVLDRLAEEEAEFLFLKQLEYTAAAQAAESGIGLIVLTKDHGAMLELSIKNDHDGRNIVTVRAVVDVKEQLQ